eukprot:TRINITY_DN5533_c0_g1_i3.p1 TRINITY_DN5533_c0_g1~~TRINITY_DN5533_c0_g1_i3.p1  ORF type:complete len:1230 (+),score=264.40 TRINITY_DN5533_c0_g1_i3:775-4464(+)
MLKRSSKDVLDPTSLAQVYGPLIFGQHLTSSYIPKFTPALSIEVCSLLIDNLDQFENLHEHEDAVLILTSLRFDILGAADSMEALKHKNLLLQQEVNHLSDVIVELNKKIASLIEENEAMQDQLDQQSPTPGKKDSIRSPVGRTNSISRADSFLGDDSPFFTIREKAKNAQEYLRGNSQTPTRDVLDSASSQLDSLVQSILQFEESQKKTKMQEELRYRLSRQDSLIKTQQSHIRQLEKEKEQVVSQALSSQTGGISSGKNDSYSLLEARYKDEVTKNEQLAEAISQMRSEYLAEIASLRSKIEQAGPKENVDSEDDGSSSTSSSFYSENSDTSSSTSDSDQEQTPSTTVTPLNASLSRAVPLSVGTAPSTKDKEQHARLEDLLPVYQYLLDTAQMLTHSKLEDISSDSCVSSVEKWQILSEAIGKGADQALADVENSKTSHKDVNEQLSSTQVQLAKLRGEVETTRDYYTAIIIQKDIDIERWRAKFQELSNSLASMIKDHSGVLSLNMHGSDYSGDSTASCKILRSIIEELQRALASKDLELKETLQSNVSAELPAGDRVDASEFHELLEQLNQSESTVAEYHTAHEDLKDHFASKLADLQQLGEVLEKDLFPCLTQQKEFESWMQDVASILRRSEITIDQENVMQKARLLSISTAPTSRSLPGDYIQILEADPHQSEAISMEPPGSPLSLIMKTQLEAHIQELGERLEAAEESGRKQVEESVLLRDSCLKLEVEKRNLLAQIEVMQQEISKERQISTARMQESLRQKQVLEAALENTRKLSMSQSQESISSPRSDGDSSRSSVSPTEQWVFDLCTGLFSVYRMCCNPNELPTSSVNEAPNKANIQRSYLNARSWLRQLSHMIQKLKETAQQSQELSVDLDDSAQSAKISARSTQEMSQLIALTETLTNLRQLYETRNSQYEAAVESLKASQQELLATQDGIGSLVEMTNPHTASQWSVSGRDRKEYLSCLEASIDEIITRLSTTAYERQSQQPSQHTRSWNGINGDPTSMTKEDNLSAGKGLLPRAQAASPDHLEEFPSQIAHATGSADTFKMAPAISSNAQAPNTTAYEGHHPPFYTKANEFVGHRTDLHQLQSTNANTRPDSNANTLPNANTYSNANANAVHLDSLSPPKRSPPKRPENHPLNTDHAPSTRGMSLASPRITSPENQQTSERDLGKPLLFQSIHPSGYRLPDPNLTPRPQWGYRSTSSLSNRSSYQSLTPLTTPR